MPVAVILVVDDDAQLRRSFAKLLQSEGLRSGHGRLREKGIEAVRARPFDLAVMDVRMPGMDGLSAFKIIHDLDPKLPVVIMTAYAATETAIEAARCGAFDFVLKPFDIPHVLDLIRQALAAGRVMRSTVAMDADPVLGKEDALLGRSQAMQDVFKAIGRAAPTEATVLVRGESGTGKELVARAVYQYSQRAEKPFLVIQLRGHSRHPAGKRTFRIRARRLHRSHCPARGQGGAGQRGHAFLDEIGDMPLTIQAKILRFSRRRPLSGWVGAIPWKWTCASSRPQTAIWRRPSRRPIPRGFVLPAERCFLNLPPLNERQEDVDYLTDHFLARFSRELGVVNPGISEGAKRALMAHSWPGNVRELANVIHKALIFSRGYPINTGEVSSALHEGPPASLQPSSDLEPLRQWVRSELTAAPRENLFEDLRDQLGAVLVEEALDITGNNRSQAARLLGISRPTLLARMDKYGMGKKELVRRPEVFWCGRHRQGPVGPCRCRGDCVTRPTLR